MAGEFVTNFPSLFSATFKIPHFKNSVIEGLHRLCLPTIIFLYTLGTYPLQASGVLGPTSDYVNLNSTNFLWHKKSSSREEAKGASKCLSTVWMDADEIALTFCVLDAVPVMSLVTSESSEGSEQGWGEDTRFLVIIPGQNGLFSALINMEVSSDCLILGGLKKKLLQSSPSIIFMKFYAWAAGCGEGERERWRCGNGCSDVAIISGLETELK